MVGSQQGQVYSGKQGIQYATVLDSVKPTLLLMEGMKKKAAEKAEGVKQTLEFKPQEVWHYYSAEANKRFEEWAKEGGAIMTQKGIGNMWTSNDPAAIAWQLKGAELKKGYDNINQAKKQWDLSMEDIRSGTGKDYTDEYRSSVENFATINGYDQIASGNFKWPQAQFKEPTNIYQGFLINDSKVLKEQLPDGRPPTDVELTNRTISYFTAPEHSADLKAMQQTFASLPENTRKTYEAMAEKEGMDKNAAPLMLARENYREQFTAKPRNVMSDAVAYAEKAPRDLFESSTEDVQGVTKGARTLKLKKGSTFPTDTATAHFNEKSYLLNDDAYLAALGVPTDLPRDEKRKLAIEAFAQKVKENIEVESKSFLFREGEGWGGYSQKEVEQNSDNWMADVLSDDKVLSRQAANWLTGTKGVGGGFIQTAEVVTTATGGIQGQILGGLPEGVQPGDAIDMLYVKFGSQEEMRKATTAMYAMKPPNVQEKQKRLDKLQKDLAAIDNSPNIPKEEKPGRKQAIYNTINALQSEVDAETGKYQRAIKSLESAAQGDVVYVPLIPANVQVLKHLHGTTGKTRGSLYEVGYNQEQQFDKPGTTLTGVPWSGPESFQQQPGKLNNPEK